VVRCNLIRFISTSGYLVVSDRFICFWGKSFATQDIKYRFTTRLVHAAKPLKLSGFSITGLVLEIEGQKDLRFEFPKEEARDKTVRRINSVLSAAKASAPSSDSNSDSTGPSSFLGDQGTGVVSASPTGARTPEECASTAVAILAPISQLHQRSKTTIFDPAILPLLPKAINMPPETFRGISPRHFVCLTIGSRGDVQPYIALGLGLIKQGHRVTIVTHEEYKIWVEAFGIAHRTAGGDPAALMKLSVDHSVRSCLLKTEPMKADFHIIYAVILAPVFQGEFRTCESLHPRQQRSEG
jgi:sterol 3beta-glucosyltransferase